MSQKREGCLLGVDLGNTKTVYALAKSDGMVIAKIRAPGANHQEIGADEMTRRLRDGITRVIRAAGLRATDLAGVYFGAAGADTKRDFEVMRPAMAAAVAVPFEFDNDCWIALYSGTLGGPGMMVTCGTGNTNCAVNTRGEKLRIGGLDDMLGDMLGARVIARYAASAAVRSDDGRGEPTILAAMIPKALGLAETAEIIALEMTSERVATVVGTFFAAAQEGDGKSLDICWMLVKETLAIVGEFYNRLFVGEDFRLVLEGSVFKQKYEPFMTMLHLALRQKYDAEIVVPPWDPVIGALILAFRMAGIDPAQDTVHRMTTSYTSKEWLQ